MYDIKTKEKVEDVKQFTKIDKIITIKHKDLVSVGKSYFAKVKIKGKEYFVKTMHILKPTGKHAIEYKMNLGGKHTQGQYSKMSSPHQQEMSIVQTFIEQSGAAWEFEYGPTLYQILRVGDPGGTARPTPKTDIAIELNHAVGSLGTNLNVSLKQENASYVEGHMLPERLIHIYGKGKSKELILKAFEYVNTETFKTSTDGCRFFINSKSNKYDIEKLSGPQALEAFSGLQKFGNEDGKAANCYFKGGNPKTIKEFLDGLKPIKQLKAPLYLQIQGRSGIIGSSAFKLNDLGEWEITAKWKSMFGI